MLFVVLCMCSNYVQAQDSDEELTGRKGQWTIELGNGFFGNFGGTSSGGSILFGDGSTLTSLGFNGGKFVSDQFAVKFNLGLLSIGNGFGGGDLYTLMGGGKYYIGGIAPIDLSAGVITGSGDSQFIGKATIGYAIGLADNINFEPSIGALFSDESADGLVQLSFALFF